MSEQRLDDNILCVCVRVRVKRHSITVQDNPKHRIREEWTRLTASSETLHSKDPFVL